MTTINPRSDQLSPVTRCPLCGASERTIFEHDHALHGDTPCTVQCDSCRLIYMDRVIKTEEIASVYAGYNTTRDERDSELEAKRRIMYRQDYAYVRRFLPQRGLLLDFGSGTGEFSGLFEDCEVHGIEVDDAARAHAAIRFPALQMHANAASAPHGPYDAIVFRGTLQYAPDLRAIVDLCTERTRTGSLIFILATPNAESLLAQTQKEYWALANAYEHRYWLSVPHLQRLFGDSFELRDRDFPYLNTPYERYTDDLKKVLAIARGENVKEKFPFFGSMMNVVFQRR
ncbi:MAG TPA: class I SAM-dependent methyltransferase [Candidatus Paceibacterota bacterium]|nr:class I SAM-dependent methyltransferase [Candidatus Paceibacterota bacterium]